MVLLNFVMQIFLSVVVGVVLGHLLPFVVGWILSKRSVITDKGVGTLLLTSTVVVARWFLFMLQRAVLSLTGWLLFFEEKTEESMGHSSWQNPLIACMVAGFVMVNYTSAGAGFEEVCGQPWHTTSAEHPRVSTAPAPRKATTDGSTPLPSTALGATHSPQQHLALDRPSWIRVGDRRACLARFTRTTHRRSGHICTPHPLHVGWTRNCTVPSGADGMHDQPSPSPARLTHLLPPRTARRRW